MNVDTVIKTGNIMVDAILNSKISLMNEKSIPVNAKAVVPENLKISDIDLCVIVGNLLDNAIEACEKQVREQSFIRMYIGVLKGQLYISVSNSVGDKIIKRGKTYVSTKGLEGHGFGIARTDSIVSKYSGYINRQNEDGIFATEVMIPL